MLAAVILSGGESSRMGSPKALVPFRGRTFLEHLLHTISAASRSAQPGRGIGAVRIVLGAHTKEISTALSLDPANIVVNPDWKSGQLSSIQAAVRNLEHTDNDGIMLFLVDHPLVSPALVAELTRNFYESGRPIVLPKCRGKRGHPVIFGRRLYPELLAAPLDTGARAVVWAHAAEVLEVPTEDEGILLNLNDPEALRRALEK